MLPSPEGERLVLDENMFVEIVLPRGILRKLTDDEMEAYRAVVPSGRALDVCG